MAIIIETCPKCGHDLIDTVICTYPPIPRKICSSCDWSWEGEPEEVIRMPFGGNVTNAATNAEKLPSLNDYINDGKINTNDFRKVNTFDELSNILIRNNFDNDACENCPSNPKNGGTGICFCTVGQEKITY